MNERIMELAKQAGSTHKQSLGVYQFYANELEKFAELILKECTDVLMQRHEESKHSHNYYHVTANMLKNHFDIK